MRAAPLFLASSALNACLARDFFCQSMARSTAAATRTQHGRAVLHGVTLHVKGSVLHLLRLFNSPQLLYLQELLTACEAALNRDDVAAARAAGDEARQAAEDCASIPLIRQVEALFLRIEAREMAQWNREQGVHM